MTISSEEAEREVEASRGELDRTVEALKDKMTPGQLLDETMRTMGDTGGQIVSKFLAQAKENPMPLAVMGLGLAWLMSSNNRERSSAPMVQDRSFAGYGSDTDAYGAPTAYDAPNGEGRGIGGKLRDAAGGVSDAMHGAADSASSAAGAVRDRMSGAASGVVHGAQDATARAKAMVGSAADKAGQYGQQTGQAVAGMVEREPLLIGGAGLLAGLAIGAALPATEAEKRYVAPMKDKVIDKTKTMAQDGLDGLNEAAQAAYHAVKDELQNGGGDGATLAQRSEDVVHAAAQSLRDQASGPH